MDLFHSKFPPFPILNPPNLPSLPLICGGSGSDWNSTQVVCVPWPAVGAKYCSVPDKTSTNNTDLETRTHVKGCFWGGFFTKKSLILKKFGVFYLVTRLMPFFSSFWTLETRSTNAVDATPRRVSSIRPCWRFACLGKIIVSLLLPLWVCFVLFGQGCLRNVVWTWIVEHPVWIQNVGLKDDKEVTRRRRRR